MKNHFPSSIIIVTIISIFLNSCDIFTDVTISLEAKVNYSDYKSFAWLPDDYDTINSPYNNEVIRNNLKNYFGQNMSKRGLRFDKEAPDMLLQLVLQNSTKEKDISIQLPPKEFYYCSYYYCSQYYSPYPFEYYYKSKNIRCNAYGNCIEKIEYVEGAITLNVIDRKLDKVIWSGTAKGDIYDPDMIKRDIHPAVIRIMKQFPIEQVVPKPEDSSKKEIYN